MKTEHSMPNGYTHLHAERSLGEEFQESVLPQITGLLSDAEAVLRSEARLIEARLLDRVESVQRKLMFAVMGVGALLTAFVLFIVTIIYGVTTIYPDVPVWAVTCALALITSLLGAYFLSGTSQTRKTEGETAHVI